MSGWAKADPADVVATAAGELAGTTTSATYGAPYNHASEGQSVLGLQLQKWGGVGVPVDSADLVLQPLRGVTGDPAPAWRWPRGTRCPRRPADRGRDGVRRRAGQGPGRRPGAGGTAAATARCPALTQAFLRLAQSGGLEGSLTSSGTFYGGDQTRSMLLLSDGAYLEDTAVADQLGGDQWGMMNEVGNYPGQPWMWLYTFWYQVKPFSTSENADAQVWMLMMGLTLAPDVAAVDPRAALHPALDPRPPADLARPLPAPAHLSTRRRTPRRAPRRGTDRGPTTPPEADAGRSSSRSGPGPFRSRAGSGRPPRWPGRSARSGGSTLGADLLRQRAAGAEPAAGRRVDGAGQLAAERRRSALARSGDRVGHRDRSRSAPCV